MQYEPLSGMDLMNMYTRLNGGKTGLPKIWTYKDLETHSLNQILGKAGKAIILFLNSDNYGHWCCLYRNKSGLNFFDSYGTKPDDQYKFMPNHLAKDLNGHLKRLTAMLYSEAEMGIPIHYNQYELQDWDDKRIATCGRWCVIRVLYSEVSVDDFKKIFKGRKKSPDIIVTHLTKI